MEEYRRLCRWRTYAIELGNIPISSQLCYVTMETIWSRKATIEISSEDFAK